ncbi:MULTISPECIES: zeta toxin family protein [unclassified Streptomyces]|uniref:zeta toxin family protein n=1 Tax=unclassified Streptomyces TaxID=2593676 RepID=UPI000DC7A0A6|nr:MULTISPECIES: zeta toxin family protein [unclassified Streptomyces]AWZ07417.1 ATP/GTP-binding protein [Streptomyces sp. ICC4]AWZ12655.1 ATP/GTP-binding protein [Streptomyces sp. ICC1]
MIAGTASAMPLGETEHLQILAACLPQWTAGAVSQDRPVLVIVAGQPGSGKTTIAELLHAALSARGGAVRISSDLYKAAHRKYARLRERDIRTAGAGVRADTRLWQAEVEEYARSARLDVVLELALADPAEIRAVSALYRAAGYRIELVVLAVAEAVSQLAVLKRFFTPDADGGGRYIAWDNQDGCATGLPKTVALVEAERLVDRVMVVRRGLEPLYDNELVGSRWLRPEAADSVLEAERLRPWDGPGTRIFRRELVRAEVLVHDERLPEDRRLAVSRDAERAAAAAEPLRRVAQPLPGPPGTGYHRLSTDEHTWIFDELIASTFLRKTVFRPDPLVVYLVAEPGARSLEAEWMLRRAMRPGTVVLDPRMLSGSHPDYCQLVLDQPRIASEAVRPDAEAWQNEAETYIRERRGDLIIKSAFADVAQFAASAARFARAGYRIEIAAIAARATDSRQRTLIRYVRAMELDVHIEFPTPAAHAQACAVAADIVAAAAADPAVSAVRVIDGDHRTLGHGHWASWALAAARRRPYTSPEAAVFHAAQRALHRRLPHLRDELDGLAAQAQPLMPPAWRVRQVESRPRPAYLPVPAALRLSSPAAVL